MIYVVTGMARSGTSMMMKILWKGGIDSYYDKKKERHLRKQHDKARNPGGFFEVEQAEKATLDFPLQAEGMAIKIMAPWKWLGSMAVNPTGYRIVVLMRDPDEIEKSIIKINKGIILTKDRYILDNYNEFFTKGLEIALNRRDVKSVTILQYAAILENPTKEISRLVPEWPINVRKAVKVVNPKFQTVAF